MEILLTLYRRIQIIFSLFRNYLPKAHCSNKLRNYFCHHHSNGYDKNEIELSPIE